MLHDTSKQNNCIVFSKFLGVVLPVSKQMSSQINHLNTSPRSKYALYAINCLMLKKHMHDAFTHSMSCIHGPFPCIVIQGLLFVVAHA